MLGERARRREPNRTRTLNVEASASASGAARDHGDSIDDSQLALPIAHFLALRRTAGLRPLLRTPCSGSALEDEKRPILRSPCVMRSARVSLRARDSRRTREGAPHAIIVYISTNASKPGWFYHLCWAYNRYSSPMSTQTDYTIVRSCSHHPHCACGQSCTDCDNKRARYQRLHRVSSCTGMIGACLQVRIPAQSVRETQQRRVSRGTKR